MEINREQFEAWLFSQPRERTFRYIDTNDCLLCKFFKENTSFKTPILGSDTIYNGETGENLGPIAAWAVLTLESVVREHCNSITTTYNFGQAQDAYFKLFPNFGPQTSTTEATSDFVALGKMANQAQNNHQKASEQPL